MSLAEKCDAVAGKAAGFGLLKKEDANLNGCVTGKALDGLFLVIGEEVKKLHQNPLGAGSDVLKKVLDEAATRSNAAPASHGVICMVTSSILAA